MNIKNTKDNYGLIARWLHWSSAFLFLMSYVSVYYRHWFTDTVARTPEAWNALQIHLSVGVTIGVLVILRIIWKLNNPTPTLEPGSKLQHAAAHLGHYALYAVMIIMPITGYLGTGAHIEYFFLFDIPQFQDTALFSWLIEGQLQMTHKELEKPMDFIHKEILGKRLILILVVGHVAAALYHHFIKKDRTLTKMLK